MVMAHAVDEIPPNSTEIMLLLARRKADVNVRGAVSSYVGTYYIVLCSVRHSL